jgi:hypothetical protein
VPALVGVTPCDPLVAGLPDQPPLALQLVPSLADQLSVALCPCVMDVGATAMLTVGGVAGVPPPPPPQAPRPKVNSRASAGKAARGL